jgi:hypothetical protein
VPPTRRPERGDALAFADRRPTLWRCRLPASRLAGRSGPSMKSLDAGGGVLSDNPQSPEVPGRRHERKRRAGGRPGCPASHGALSGVIRGPCYARTLKSTAHRSSSRLKCLKGRRRRGRRWPPKETPRRRRPFRHVSALRHASEPRTRPQPSRPRQEKVRKARITARTSTA